MLNDYSDIRERIPELPKWFDENGVPRYCEFSPMETADIYADEAALLLIACQACATEFNVCMSMSVVEVMVANARGRDVKTLAEQIEDRSIHYGDPPNACPDHCRAGATMNCDDIRVIQYWHKPDFEWQRVHKLEIDVSNTSSAEKMAA